MNRSAVLQRFYFWPFIVFVILGIASCQAGRTTPEVNHPPASTASALPEVEEISATEYRFWVVHVDSEGYQYTAHACCMGNPAQTPFVWIFPYTVRKINDAYQVLDTPPLLE